MAANIVPFGKYKGQPVESLIADSDYCEWLSAQPWFRDRYTGIYQIVINGPQQPVETPEHNEMQAWFLTRETCMALGRLVAPRWIDRARPSDPVPTNGRWVAREIYDATVRVVKAALERHPDCFTLVRHGATLGKRRFEDSGWDVTFVIRSAWFEIHRTGEIPCICPPDAPPKSWGTHVEPCLWDHAVREALVCAGMPAVPREDVAPLLEDNPDLTAYYQRRAEAVVDAILAALAPGEAG